jgi:uracil-DNA glycosylase family 4
MSDPKEILNRVTDFLNIQEEVYAPIQILPEINELPEVQEEEITISEQETEPSEMTLEQKLLQCNTLEDLKELCLGAEELRTDLEGTNLVFGKGNPNADLMIIGEAPGANEDEQGEPFVGRAGQLLTKILEAIKFSRDQVYIANILKHRPPDNRNPLPEERARSLPYLERQIDLVQPKLILCLGLVSAHTLLSTSLPLKDLRVKFHRYRKVYELTVTYHPAALLRNPNWKRETWEDVQKLRNRYDELGCKP